MDESARRHLGEPLLATHPLTSVFFRILYHFFTPFLSFYNKDQPHQRSTLWLKFIFQQQVPGYNLTELHDEWQISRFF